MKKIKHNYLTFDKPNYILVSNYFNSIHNWHFYNTPPKNTQDIGMWHIKYK